MENNEEGKITIPLPNGYSLVATRNADPNYNFEIYVGIVDSDGVWYQDLAIIRNAYSINDNLNVVLKEGEFEVLVYSDKNQEDYTNKFHIGLYKEPKENSQENNCSDN